MKKIHQVNYRAHDKNCDWHIVGTINKNFPDMMKKTNQNHLKLESITAGDMQECQK